MERKRQKIISGMQELLEKAISLALQAHKGQKDKGGAPYILHSLSVMYAVKGEEAKIVAVLHDVLEDSPLTLAELRQEGFSTEVLNALDLVTKKPGQAYEEYIRLISENQLARLVKLADLEDNIKEARLSHIGEDDRNRIAKYKAAIVQLTL